MTADESIPAAEPLLAVHADGGCLAIPLRLVRRLDRLTALTRIPRAPSGVAGITEIRGRVVTVLDTSEWLVGSRTGEEAGPRADAAADGVAIRLTGRYAHLALAVPAAARIEVGGRIPGSAVRLVERRLGEFVRPEPHGRNGGAPR